MNRTVIIISAVFVLALGAIIGTYFFLLKGSNGDTATSIRDVLPFGLGDSDRDASPRAPSESDELGSETSPGDSAVLPELRQLHGQLVAGAITFEDLGTSTIRFIERESGHVFEISEDERVARRVTNTTLPRIQEALWATKDTVLLRYLNDSGDVQTYVASVSLAPPGEGIGELSGEFLTPDATSIAVRPGAAFYTVASERRGYVENLQSGVAQSVLSTQFTEWLPEWLSTSRIALTTKPSANATGALYILNTGTGSMLRVLGGKFGLTTLIGPDENQVLFSERSNSSFSLQVFDVRAGTATVLPQHTLPEKCVWSLVSIETIYCGIPEQVPAGEYPDSWYQGRVSFSDTIWTLNIADGTSELLARPEDTARVPIDVTMPMLTEDESHLIFVNKKDGALWSLKLPTER